MASVKAIKLNEEQTRKFLSFFVKEALETAKKELEQEKSSIECKRHSFLDQEI